MNQLSANSTVRLHNGVEMPLLGLSTEEIARTIYNLKTQKELLLDAIEAGFRFFDTAETHTNIHRALGMAIRESGIPREEFFISSKMRVDEMMDGRYYQAFEENILQLGTEYLDLYSIHWPAIMNTRWPRYDGYITAFTGREISKTENGDADGLIALYEKGLARAIGVCHYEVHHLKALLASPLCKVKPMINQSHFHPLFAAPELRGYCAENDIAFGGLLEHNELEKPTKPHYFTDVHRLGMRFQTSERAIRANKIVRVCDGYSNEGFQVDPYRRECNPRAKENYFDDFPALLAIGKKYGKTNAQVVTRWSLQHGVVTTSKAARKVKMQETIDVFDFALTEEEMCVIDGLHAGLRIGYHPDYIDF